jgi:biotin carboxylase
MTTLTPRLALLSGPSSYRTGAFQQAARRLGIDVTLVVDTPDELEVEAQCDDLVTLDFTRSEAAIAALGRLAASRRLSGMLSLDDSATLLAAQAAAALGWPHNDPGAALAARNKWVMRQALQRGGVPVPEFQRYSLATDPARIAAETRFPVVVKPTTLSGSRGVIRANDADEFIYAWERAKRIVQREGENPDDGELLVEEYLPGIEVALEGLLTAGALTTLALFDKPDPLEGPFFEETIYVTPSRLPEATQAAVSTRVAEAAAALGLREGPVHAELRLNDAGIWLIEMAGRSIGGLCSTVLEFGAGISLEEVILRHAAGLALPIRDTERSKSAAGVMMIPIPRGGILRGVEGIEEARNVPHITGIEITAPLNQPLTPLPEGASYLGFIFARADDPAEVEQALRDAHERLTFRISAAIPLLQLP